VSFVSILGAIEVVGQGFSARIADLMLAGESKLLSFWSHAVLVAYFQRMSGCEPICARLQRMRDRWLVESMRIRSPRQAIDP
jgi:hypothetical protein